MARGTRAILFIEPLYSRMDLKTIEYLICSRVSDPRIRPLQARRDDPFDRRASALILVAVRSYRYSTPRGAELRQSVTATSISARCTFPSPKLPDSGSSGLSMNAMELLFVRQSNGSESEASSLAIRVYSHRSPSRKSIGSCGDTIACVG